MAGVAVNVGSGLPDAKANGVLKQSEHLHAESRLPIAQLDVATAE
jgi:hypothetical protein